MGDVSSRGTAEGNNDKKAQMPRSGIIIAFIAIVALTGAGVAREGLGARLDMDRLGEIQTGAFGVIDPAPQSFPPPGA